MPSFTCFVSAEVLDTSSKVSTWLAEHSCLSSWRFAPHLHTQFIRKFQNILWMGRDERSECKAYYIYSLYFIINTDIETNVFIFFCVCMCFPPFWNIEGCWGGNQLKNKKKSKRQTETPNHRIVELSELSGLERTFQIIESNHQPNTDKTTAKLCP